MSVTPAMFETALRKLGQRAFNLDEVELEHLVTTFDTDGNGTVELDEFMTFCLSIPSLPWRAEKVRRCRKRMRKIIAFFLGGGRKLMPTTLYFQRGYLVLARILLLRNKLFNSRPLAPSLLFRSYYTTVFKTWPQISLFGV